MVAYNCKEVHSPVSLMTGFAPSAALISTPGFSILIVYASSYTPSVKMRVSAWVRHQESELAAGVQVCTAACAAKLSVSAAIKKKIFFIIDKFKVCIFLFYYLMTRPNKSYATPLRIK